MKNRLTIQVTKNNKHILNHEPVSYAMAKRRNTDKARSASDPVKEKMAAKLARERLAVLGEMDQVRAAAMAAGEKIDVSPETEQDYLWSRRKMDAERDASRKKRHPVVAIKAHLKRMKELEERVKQLFQAQQVSRLEVLAAKVYRLEAEFWLA